jgi:hypothetical protein
VSLTRANSAVGVKDTISAQPRSTPEPALECSELAVVVIGLGAPRQLVDAVRSILNQDVSAEIVVVNSGGGQAAALLATAGIKVPVHETRERLYPGTARNIGIRNTKAPWIAFLAADCLAAPGWVAERLRLHKGGAGMVASAVMPDRPDRIIAWAHHLLLFPARLPGLPPTAATRYGVSFDRRLFEIFGLFDGSLRTGEDTEFLSRVTTRPEAIWWAPTVITLHRNSRSILSLLGNQVIRGYRYAIAMRRLRGTSPLQLARDCVLDAKHARHFAKAGLSGQHLKLAMASLCLVRVGSIATAVGILAALPRIRRIGAAPEPRRVTTAVPLAPTATQYRHPMIDHWLKDPSRPMRSRRRPLVLAAFSFRYDHHLVPDLLANLEPIVDGWVSFDDRGSSVNWSDERRRRRALIDAARVLGARWILAVDPDERFEVGLAEAMPQLISLRRPTAWSFNYREMYSPSHYRVDGLWGKKRTFRLFSMYQAQNLSGPPLHGCWFPQDGSYELKHSGLNLYHLRMISIERRRLRRDVYNALDPERRYQNIGYDYLADDQGARFEMIRPGREYYPPHIDDGGLWSVSREAIS